MLTNALNFIMNSRVNAAFVVVLCCILPGLNWITMSILSLITLQKGEVEGVKLIGWMLIPGIFYAYMGNAAFLWQEVLITAMSVWVLSIVLRRTTSWLLVFEIAIILGLVGVIVLYVFFPLWIKELIQALQSSYFGAISELGVAKQNISTINFANIINNYAVGFFVFFIILHILFLVGLGRFFQAKLYKPQGFKQEFGSLSVGWLPGVLLGLTLLGLTFNLVLAKAFLPIVLIPYILVGISVTHFFANKRKHTKVILIFFYSAVVVIEPLLVFLLVIAGFLERFLNFRMLKQD